jgi:hypothetical protein
MRTYLGLVAVGLFACNGNGDTDTDTTDELIWSDGSAQSVDGTIGTDSVDADASSKALLSSVATITGDDEVQALLGEDDTSRMVDPERCWDHTRSGLVIELDFTPCDDIEGHATVQKHVLGPITIFFKPDFVINGKDINGYVALEHVLGKGLTFAMHNSDAAGTAGAATVQVKDLVRTAEVTLTGYIKAEVVADDLYTWGSGTSTVNSVSQDFVFGGTDATAVDVEDPPADVAMLFEMPPETCRCPLEGEMAMGIELNVTEINFDFNDFVNIPQDLPAVEYTLETPIEASGTLFLTWGPGCGDLLVGFEEDDPVTYDISAEELLAIAQEKCDDETFGTTACGLLIPALERLSKGRVITVDSEKLEELAQILVDSEFDGSFCEVPEEDTD